MEVRLVVLVHTLCGSEELGLVVGGKPAVVRQAYVHGHNRCCLRVGGPKRACDNRSLENEIFVDGPQPLEPADSEIWK